MIRSFSLALALTALMVAPVSAQSAAPAAPPAAAPAQDAEQKPDPAQPQGFAYNAQGRRDPFVSLMRRGSELTNDPTSGRVTGLPGLAASEVTLSGIIASGGGYVAMLEGVDRKTYIVRQGDTLLDGTIRAISADTLVILQRVAGGPLAPATEREVRKVLRQEEAN